VWYDEQYDSIIGSISNIKTGREVGDSICVYGADGLLQMTDEYQAKEDITPVKKRGNSWFYEIVPTPPSVAVEEVVAVLPRTRKRNT